MQKRTFADLLSAIQHDPREARASVRVDDDKVPVFAEFGAWPSGLNERSATGTLGSARRWLSIVSDAITPNAIFLDTTTLRAVSAITFEERYDYISAETLLDLSTFVDSVVLYDHVFHLENKEVDPFALNEKLNEPIIIPIPIEKFYDTDFSDLVDGSALLLAGLWDHTCAYFNDVSHAVYPGQMDFEDRQALLVAWSKIFNVEQKFINIFDASDITHTFSSDSNTLLSELAAASDFGWGEIIQNRMNDGHISDENKASLNILGKIAAESNHRSLFNSALSYGLCLPYAPNIMRLPFRRLLQERTHVISKHLRLSEFLHDEFKNYVESYSSSETLKITMPFFLGAILSKIDSLNDFFNELLNIRHRCEALRRHRVELEEALYSGNVREIKYLRNALSEDASHLIKLMPYAATLAAVAAVLPLGGQALKPTIISSVAILTLASQYSRDDIRKLCARFSRPYLPIIYDISRTAESAANALPKVVDLWSPPSSRIEMFRKRMNALQTF